MNTPHQKKNKTKKQYSAGIWIQWNKMADSAAKTAQNKPLDTHFKIHFTDIKKKHKYLYKTKWQNYWDNFQNNKLHEIMPQTWKSLKTQTKIIRRGNIIKSKNRTLTHYPFIPPQKRRGLILNTMQETVYNQTHTNRMYRLKTNTTKILPNNKFKTNFLPDKF